MSFQSQTHFMAKFAGLVLLLGVIPSLASFGSMFLFSSEKAALLTSADHWQILTAYLFQVIAGLVLIFASGAVLRWLSAPIEVPDGTFDALVFERTCVGLTGIYFVVTGAASALLEIGRIFAHQLNSHRAYGQTSQQLLNAEVVASLTYAVGILVFGLIIVVMRIRIVDRLAKLDTRFRKSAK